MATFEITMPDGSTYEVDGPETMTEGQARDAVMSNIPTKETAFDSFSKHMNRLGYGAREPLQAGAQMLRSIMPDGVSDAVDQIDPFMFKATNGVLGHKSPNLNQTLQEQETAYKRDLAPEGFDFVRAGGNLLASAPLALANAPGLAGAALMGGASGLLQPVNDRRVADDPMAFALEKAAQVGTGAVTGGVLHGALSPLLGGIRGQAGLQELRDSGVQPTVGQALGGWIGNMEQKAQSMPIVGDAIRMARQNARDQFNNATINRAVSGLEGDVAGTGTTAIGYAHGLINDAYDMAKAAVNPFKPDYLDVLKVPGADQLSKAGHATFTDHVRTLLRGYGTLDGNLYKAVDADIGNLAATYKGSASAQDKLIGQALSEAKDRLKNQAMEASPEAADLMRRADTAFAGIVPIDRASNAAGLQGGVFTPGQLVNAVKASDRSARKNQFAQGNANGQDWAVDAQKILGDVYPDSGTPGRLLGIGGTAAGLAHYEPHTLVGMALAGAGAHPNLQSALIDALTRNPGLASEIMRRLMPVTSGEIDTQMRGMR